MKTNQTSTLIKLQSHILNYCKFAFRLRVQISLIHEANFSRKHQQIFFSLWSSSRLCFQTLTFVCFLPECYSLFCIGPEKNRSLEWTREGFFDTVVHVSNAGQWKKVALKGFNTLECFVRNSKYKYHFCLLARKPHRVAFVSCCNDFPPKVVFVTESQSNVRSAEVRALLMTLIWSDFHTVCNAVSFHLPLWSLLMFFCAWINHKKAQERSRSYIKNILL